MFCRSARDPSLPQQRATARTPARARRRSSGCDRRFRGIDPVCGMTFVSVRRADRLTRFAKSVGSQDERRAPGADRRRGGPARRAGRGAAARRLTRRTSAARPSRPRLRAGSGWRARWRRRGPTLQEPSGRLGDYTDALPGAFGRHAGTRYGDAVSGYALIDAGLRERDPRLVQTGIRAISFATDPARRPSRPSVFEQFAVAAAYNLARRQLAGDPGFERARERWESVAAPRQDRRAPARRPLLQPLARRRGRSARAAAHGPALERPQGGAGRRRGARAAARRGAGQRPHPRPAAAARPRGAVRRARQPARLPRALARALRARRPPARPRRPRRQPGGCCSKASGRRRWSMAPNGSLAYFGRSQEEAWAPAGRRLRRRLHGGAARLAARRRDGRAHGRLSLARAARARLPDRARGRRDRAGDRSGAATRLARPRRLRRRSVDGRACADDAQLDARAAPARAFDGPAAGRLPARARRSRRVAGAWRSCAAARPGTR